jgi:pimeloyl-ACP methyl ester carboxylesterase
MQTENITNHEKSVHVSLPDGRRLHFKIAGPSRASPTNPAIILIHGLGGTAREWSEVQRCVARYATVCLYERAGYHGSDPPTQPPTCENIAKDLRALLKAARVDPPYFLVGHSYGGVIARQVLRDVPDEVAGMVLLDSVPVVRRFPAEWTRLLGGSTYEEVVGLVGNRAVSEKEWQMIADESMVNEALGGIAEVELNLMAPGNQQLNESLQGREVLGDQRLCVVFCDESNDFRKVYEHAVRHNFGTVAEREIVRKHLETMSAEDEAAQRTQLALSSQARFIKTEGKLATHNVHLVDPVWVSEQIMWVYGG